MKGASRTAGLVAAYRARSTASDQPICRDAWADALAGEEGHEIAARLDAVNPHMALWVAARTAHLDARVRALASEQVVILGAGLDTRAARLAHESTRFFEVDAPESAAEKQRGLARLEGYPVDAAHYVTCNFETEDFVDRLVQSGFDLARPAVIVWEGVSYYLSEEAVMATLARVAERCHPETTLLFDFVGKKFIEARTKSPTDDEMRALVRDLGEPMIWGTNDVLPILFDQGFRKVRIDSFDEIVLGLTGTYERERRFRFQYIAEASVA